MYGLRLRVLVALLVSQCWAQSAPAQADLNGRWILGSTVFEITQVGSSVSFTYFGFPFSGMITPDGHLTGTLTGAPCSPPGGGIDARLKADVYLDGLASCPPTGFDRFFARRCQCFDGNVTNGDGCDSECQIEPCFACSGDPSVCTPLGDGAPCDDGGACTNGEVCTGGVCGGGTTNTTFCVDMTGRWRIEGLSSLIGPFVFTQDIVQRNDVLEFRSVANGALGHLGTINPFTGAFTVSTPVTDLFCVAFNGFDLVNSVTGAASFSRPLFVANAIAYAGTSTFCFEDAGSMTGSRCGGGILDPGEQCDDGNADDGDGCSSSCQTEAATAVPEHLKCYGVKDLGNPAFVSTSIDLADEFAVNDGVFEAKKPFLFCTPVSVDGSPIVTSGAYLTCYKTKGPRLRSSVRPRIEIGDALGTLQLELKKPRFVCLRSTKTPLL